MDLTSEFDEKEVLDINRVYLCNTLEVCNIHLLPAVEDNGTVHILQVSSAHTAIKIQCATSSRFVMQGKYILNIKIC